MTWQRIDDDTFIDDTLVTCAEYQLFIDEMREQGKYYQPDHWASYQFPKGQAQEPILGVRHSDAVAFCKWLTKRNEEKSKWRLPTSDEAIISPLKPYKKELMGYWLDKDFEFAWINPENAKNVEVDRNTPYERGRYSARTRVIIIDNAVFKNATSNNATNTPQTAIENIRNLELDRNKCINLMLSEARTYEFSDFTWQSLFEEDILILRERIAGRYPPYEGIRLLRELLLR